MIGQGSSGFSTSWAGLRNTRTVEGRTTAYVVDIDSRTGKGTICPEQEL